MTENRKSLWLVFDQLGNPYGPFETTEAIAAFIKRKWPDQKQDDENTGQGGEGWNIVALLSPIE